MASFGAIRDGLKTRLLTISDLRVNDTAPSTIEPPCAIVAPGGGQFITYNTTFDHGSDDMRFTVWLLVSKAWDRTAQDALDAYLDGSGPRSIRAAIEDAPVVGAQFAAVKGVSGYGQVVYAGIPYYGCQFAVSVGVI